MIDIKSQAEGIGIDAETLENLYKVFMKTTGTDLAQLKEAVSLKQMSNIRTILHHIKGAARALDLEKIALRAGTLEDANDVELCKKTGESIPELEALLGDLKRDIRSR